MNTKFFSYNRVLIGDWYVKASSYNGQIVLVMTHKENGKTDIRFFTNEFDAVRWVEFIVETS
jgi:hypothetical protein